MKLNNLFENFSSRLHRIETDSSDADNDYSSTQTDDVINQTINPQTVYNIIITYITEQYPDLKNEYDDKAVSNFYSRISNNREHLSLHITHRGTLKLNIDTPYGSLLELTVDDNSPYSLYGKLVIIDKSFKNILKKIAGTNSSYSNLKQGYNCDFYRYDKMTYQVVHIICDCLSEIINYLR